MHACTHGQLKPTEGIKTESNSMVIVDSCIVLVLYGGFSIDSLIN